jgi:uncharacterized DUF497 family protein
VEFGWTQAKRDNTLAERGIDFAAVTVGFLDPGRRIVRDVRRDYGEERFNMLAKCGARLFHVTYTMRGSIIWIISARKANHREQRRYEKP